MGVVETECSTTPTVRCRACRLSRPLARSVLLVKAVGEGVGLPHRQEDEVLTAVEGVGRTGHGLNGHAGATELVGGVGLHPEDIRAHNDGAVPQPAAQACCTKIEARNITYNVLKILNLYSNLKNNQQYPILNEQEITKNSKYFDFVYEFYAYN